MIVEDFGFSMLGMNTQKTECSMNSVRAMYLNALVKILIFRLFGVYDFVNIVSRTTDDFNFFYYIIV